MSSGAFDLGSFGAEIVIDDSQFQQTMRNSEESLTSHEGKMNSWAGKMGLITAGAVAGLTASIVGIGVAGVKMSDDLHKALNGLQASTGATNEEMAGMEQSLKNIYNNNYGEDFKDIADSMAMVKQNTGLAGKELESATQNALALRDTFEFDVNESTNAANSLMKQFGITSQQAFNLIAQGAQNGANKNGDLIDTLNEYAPQFKAMGFSAEQFTNVLIDGAKNGQFSIDKVGDAMKEFNIRAKDLSQTSLDAYKSLGMNGEQMSASFAKGGESAQKAFQQVMTALNKVKDPVEQNRIGVELFGTQFEDLQAKGISSLAKIGNTASLTKDSLSEINKVKYDSLGEAMEGIKRNLTTGLIDPIEKDVMPQLNTFADWITKHMPEIKSGIETSIGSVVSVFKDLGDAVKWTSDHMNILLPIITGVTGAITAQMIVGTISSLYSKWRLATEAQTTAQWLLNAAMDANPIGLVALAIGGLIAAGVALWKNWDTVKSYAVSLWDKMGNLKPMLLGLLGPFGAIVGAGISVYKNWDTIMEKAEQLGSKIKTFFSSLKFHIPLPHFDLKTIYKKIAGISVPVPDLDINWYATGGIVDKPTILGAGEAGAEAIVPLIGRRMDPFADAIYKRLSNKLSSNNTNNQQVTVHNDVTFNVSKNVTEQDMDRMVKHFYKSNQNYFSKYGLNARV